MNERIVLHSLEELGQVAGFLEPEDDTAPPHPDEVEVTTDLSALAAAASRAAAQLQELVDRDAVARRQAELAVSQHHRLQEEIAQLERIVAEANAVQTKAGELSERGFDPACRSTAVDVAAAVKAVAVSAEATLARLRSEAAELAEREDVAKLVAEERERSEAIQRAAEARQRASEFGSRLDDVDTLLRQAKENEAGELLGHLESEQPNDSGVASRIDNLRRRLWGVKTVKVEDALREARRLHRREPSAAIERLQDLDLTGMPEPLVRQVYGCWLDACRRLRVTDAVHYSPSFGRGAVLKPADGERLEVISAIGIQRWQPGACFASTGLRGARPLS